MQRTGTDRMKWLAILLVLGAMVGGLAWWHHHQRAKPTDDARTIVLDVEPGGRIRLGPLESEAGGRATLDNQVQVQHFLRRVCEDSMSRVTPEERPNGPPVRVVIRSDARAKPTEVDAIRTLCAKAGFKDVEVEIQAP